MLNRKKLILLMILVMTSCLNGNSDNELITKQQSTINNYNYLIEKLTDQYRGIGFNQHNFDLEEFINKLNENQYTNVNDFNNKNFCLGEIDNGIKKFFEKTIGKSYSLEELIRFLCNECGLKYSFKPEIHEDFLTRLKKTYEVNKSCFLKQENQYYKLYNWLVEFINNDKISDPENIVKLFEECDTTIKAKNIIEQIYPLTDYNNNNINVCKSVLKDSFESFDGISTIKFRLSISDKIIVDQCVKYNDSPCNFTIDNKKTIFDYVWLEEQKANDILYLLTSKINQKLKDNKRNLETNVKLNKPSNITTVDYLTKVINLAKNIDNYDVGNELGADNQNTLNNSIKKHLRNNLKTVIEESLRHCSDYNTKLKSVLNVKDLIIKLFRNVWTIVKEDIDIEYHDNELSIKNIIIRKAKNKMDEDLAGNEYNIQNIWDNLKNYLNDCGIVQSIDGDKTYYQIVYDAISTDFDVRNIEKIKDQLSGISTTKFNENLLNDKVKICDIETQLANLKTTLNQPVNQPFDTTGKFVLSTNGGPDGDGLVKVIANIKSIYQTYKVVKNSVTSVSLSPKETDLVNAILKIYYGNDIEDVKNRKTILGFHLGTDDGVDDSLFCCISKTGISQYITNETDGLKLERLFRKILTAMIPKGTIFKHEGKSLLVGFGQYDVNFSLLFNFSKFLEKNMVMRIPFILSMINPVSSQPIYKITKLQNDDFYDKKSGDRILGKNPFDTPGIAQLLGLIGDINKNTGSIEGNYEYYLKETKWSGITYLPFKG